MTTLEPKTNTRHGARVALPRQETSTTSLPFEKPTTLTRAVQKAVRELDQTSLRPVSRRDAGVAFQPRMLVAVLSYCYARGIYGSAEIENVMRRDKNFRAFCQNEFPYAHTIASFRRHNRDAIRDCLAAVLRFLGMQIDPLRRDELCESQFAAEADRRIDNAVLMDSIDRDR